MTVREAGSHDCNMLLMTMPAFLMMMMMMMTTMMLPLVRLIMGRSLRMIMKIIVARMMSMMLRMRTRTVFRVSSE